MKLATHVRAQRSDDFAAIRAVNSAAFGRADEADLVDALRISGAMVLSLVAECDGQIAGHILFSRMWIDDNHGSTPAVALAPVAVLPELQKRGIGSALIKKGVELLNISGERIVLVLGEPAYYQRFGFSAALAASIRTPFPLENFMALELQPEALLGVSGSARYHAAFSLENPAQH